MNSKHLVPIFVLAFLSASIASAQVPVATHIQILKAEDARRYDAVLEGLMKSPNAAVRARAALAAGRIGDKAAVPALIKLLNGDASDKVREMAAFALGEVESIDAADAIRMSLGDTAKPQMPGAEKANVRARLVEAAGKIAAANAQDPKAKELAEAINFVLASEKNRQTSIETTRLALTAALRARPAGAEENIRFFLSHTDPGVVSDALNTLARLRAKNANRDARDLLETHSNAVVRANAARVLGAAEAKEAVDLLIKAATTDTDSRVRVSAIRSLGALKEERAGAALEAYQDTIVKRVSAREKKAASSNVSPAELSELLEIATALGNIMAGKKLGARQSSNPRLYEDAPPNLMTPLMGAAETSIARAKIDPNMLMLGLLERVKTSPAPMFKSWRSYSSLAQGLGVVAGLKNEVYGEDLDRHRREAEEVLRIWLRQESLPPNAVPDVLTAYAAFKPEDLGETARRFLAHPDVFVRASAAGTIEDLPASKENVDALKSAFTKALLTDKKENDAQLGILNALYKLDKKESVGTLLVALGAPDYLVRKSAFDKLSNAELHKDFPGLPTSIENARKNDKDKVLPYSAVFGTRLGQVLNTDVDYRRALSRKNGSISAVFTTAKGTFTIEFLPEDAPLTVDNFVKLARSGYFNGLEVHRVVPNFVMQDGDPLGNGSGGPGWSIRCEMNMIPYERGAVGMALSGKDTGGSQWFVTHSPQPHLDGGYTVFGRVNETGMKVVDRIVRGDKIVSVRIVGR